MFSNNHIHYKQTTTMTYSYYFNTDERDYSVRAPQLSRKEKFDMLSDDDKWFDYMRNKQGGYLFVGRKDFNNNDDDDVCDYQDEVVCQEQHEDEYDSSIESCEEEENEEEEIDAKKK